MKLTHSIRFSHTLSRLFTVTAPTEEQGQAAKTGRRMDGWMETIRGMEAEDITSIIPIIWAVYTEHG